MFAPPDVIESELRLASAESLDTLIEKRKISGFFRTSFNGDRPGNLILF
jgi:hypothetical protein